MAKRPGERSCVGNEIEHDSGSAHIRAERTWVFLRATRVCAALMLAAYAASGQAALGGTPQSFGSDANTIVSSASTAATSYTIRDTTLASGTQVREYVSADGIVFALTWSGPVLPDLEALLGQYFDTMVAASASRPRAGRSHLGVNTPAVVINSGGHMRALEGSAWLPAQLPPGFSADDIR